MTAARCSKACGPSLFGRLGCKRDRMTRLFGLILMAYVLSYSGLRVSWTEVWEKDGSAYMIFPLGAEWVYYLFRPLVYVDGAVTGLRFHIGPHQ
jgi:hypothetical protein